MAGSIPKRLLVVDDDEDDFFLLCRVLRLTKEQWEVDRVANGAQAMQLLGRHGRFEKRRDEPLPDLILLDLRLPGTEGFEVLEWMRQDPTFARVPVVVWSSLLSETDRQRACELGVQDFLVKPESLGASTDLARALCENLRARASK